MFKKFCLLCFFVVAAAVFSCKKPSNNQNVQTNCTVGKAISTPINYTIQSGSGEFFPISIIGGHTYINGYGISGIVVYRLSQSQFLAFERSCTKDGCTNVKSLVWVQPGNTSLKDSICGSIFSIMDGSIQTGPATVPLYQYHTSWDGNLLHIYN